jgi:hypothetical protein
MKQLAAAFADPPVTVVKHADQYRLSDESLDDVDDATHARAALRRTLIRINALAHLQWEDDYVEVRAGVLGRPGDAGGIDFYESVTISGGGRISVEGVAAGPEGQVMPKPPSPLPAKLQLAVTDSNVDDALYFLQRLDPDWHELYKAYEIVRDDANPPERRGWASEREITRFRRTANHQDAAGRGARHARLAAEPPSDPMTLDDARALIRRVVSAWVGEKVT